MFENDGPNDSLSMYIIVAVDFQFYDRVVQTMNKSVNLTYRCI